MEEKEETFSERSSLDEVYELFKSSKKSLEILFKQYLENSDNSLEDKWNKLITVGKDLELTGYCYLEPEGIDWDKRTLYDDFYIDKYQTYDVLSLFETAKEKNILEDEIAFKQHCIEEGNFYYLNDW